VRNFILFVRRFFNLILFLGLEIVCFVLIARTNTLQGNDVMSSANVLVGLLYQKREDVVYYFGLKTMNDSLLRENLRLRSELAALQTVDTLKDSTAQISFVGNDSLHKIQYATYKFLEARVINNAVNAANNFITINRGYKQGVRKNMAVLSGSGVVGEVIHVSANFSSILSILNVKRKISAQLKDGTTGFVSWESTIPDQLILEDISKEVKIYKGDSIFTTNYSLFPANMLIGTVWKRKVNKKTNEQILYLKSATNFRNLQYVYVVDDQKMAERKQLEALTNEDK